MKLLRNILFIAICCSMMRIQASSAGTADYVFVGGKIYTLDDKQPWVEALAVSGSDIIYVGDNEGVREFIDSSTQTIELNKKMMLPGFVTTDENPVLLMGLSAGFKMPKTDDVKSVLREIKSYVEGNEKGPFLSYGGIDDGSMAIHRRDLDEIVPDKPFLVITTSGNEGWANSKALKLAGVLKAGSILAKSFSRNDDGEFNGLILDSSGVSHMLKALNIFTQKNLLKEADPVLNFMSERGITTNYNISLIPGTEKYVFTALAELEKQGGLNVRMVCGVNIDSRDNVKRGGKILRRFSTKYSSELFNVHTLVVHADAVFENQNNDLLAPFEESRVKIQDTSLPADQLSSVMLDAAGAGLNVYSHVVGDKAVNEMLTGMMIVRVAGFKDTRLNMGNVNLIRDSDKNLLNEIDIGIVTTTGKKAIAQKVWLEQFGEKYHNKFLPMKSIIDKKNKLALSGKWPASPLNPLHHMAIAMTRKFPDGKIIEPNSERLSLDEAIHAYTIDAAYLLDMDELIGSIQVGKRADLIIFDQNLFDLAPEKVAQARILKTMVNGKFVYDSSQSVQ